MFSITIKTRRERRRNGMQYHRKGESRRTKARQRWMERLAGKVYREEGLSLLAFPKGQPMEFHRRLLYSELPVQEAYNRRGFQCRNGMVLRDVGTVLMMARMGGMSVETMARRWGNRAGEERK